MAKSEKVENLLKEHGAILVRHKKHNVWRLPDGRSYVTPKTPSDEHSELNSYTDLRKFLGLSNLGKVQEFDNTKKPKILKTGREKDVSYKPAAFNNSLAAQLSLKGVTEKSLREEIEQLTREKESLQTSVIDLRHRNSFLKTSNKMYSEELENLCWFCRLRNWITIKFLG